MDSIDGGVKSSFRDRGAQVQRLGSSEPWISILCEGTKERRGLQRDPSMKIVEASLGFKHGDFESSTTSLMVIFKGEQVQIVLEDGRETTGIKLACSSEDCEVIVKLSVFYTFSAPQFEELYTRLISQFPHYDFVLENRATNLDQILHLIKDTRMPAGYLNFFQFNVDDMLFFNYVNLNEILTLLDAKRDKLYGAHLKLYPGINYSHTTDKIISMVPKFTDLSKSLQYLSYTRSDSELDWNYPFDFCGSIYLLERVQAVIDGIEDREKIRKPNQFEYIGNLAIKKKGLANAHPMCMCLNQPVMTVITVNKVQDVYDTPVYEFKGDGEEECLEVMNQCMRDAKELDIGYYRGKGFSSVHVGDFKILKDEIKTHPMDTLGTEKYNFRHL